MAELSKKPIVRCELDTKKTEPIHSRVSYELFQALENEAKELDKKRSSVINDILTEHFSSDGLLGLPGRRDAGLHRLPGRHLCIHPAEQEAREFCQLTFDLFSDGTPTLRKKQRWAKKMFSFANQVWNEKQVHEQEESA